MGEKQLSYLFNLLKGLQSGDILMDGQGHERFKLVFKEAYYNIDTIKIFLNLLEKVTDDQIKAYMREIDNSKCEVYIHL
ncbi:MAG: hypothetical protein QW327_02330 [Candidatus Odinarchaeota archaeon]